MLLYVAVFTFAFVHSLHGKRGAHRLDFLFRWGYENAYQPTYHLQSVLAT